MKKQLLLLALLTTGILQAQIWSENFNSTSANALPAGWSQNNVDGFPVTPNLAGYNFGTNAWVTNDLGAYFPAQGRCVMSTSWYTPSGTANDWLITPSFTVPAGAYIEWVGRSSQAAYPDGYQVKISTTGTTVASFTTNLLTVPSESYAAMSAPWATRSASLGAYATQTVYIAFVNNSNDMNRLYLDDIKVVVPVASDGNVMNVTSVPRYTVAGAVAIGGKFKNYGTTVANNATMNYKIDNGSTTTETIALSALNCLQTANYTFTTNANLTVGAHTVKVWVTQVNGVNETITTNDTASSTVYVASQTALMNALIEEFTSSTCGACALQNTTFDGIVNSNSPNTGGRVNAIKYEVNWPSTNDDPSYNSDVEKRKLFYANGGINTGIAGGDFDMAFLNQIEINDAKNEPAYSNITATLNVTGSVITGSATIMPFLTITSGSPLRIHQALIQKDYAYNNPSTTQKTFYHVVRQMYPDGNGAPISVTDGIQQTVSFNHTVNIVPIYPPLAAQNSNNFWTAANQVFEYVVFLQDAISGQVLQSGSATAMLSGIVKLTKDSRIGVYPNPSSDLVTVGIRLDGLSTVDITIYDITGKIVYSNKGAQVKEGDSEIRINTSEFANGTYSIKVNTAEGILMEKLIINK